jgi:hypothetical protein
MNPLEFPRWATEFPDYEQKFSEQLITDTLTDIEIFNHRKDISEEQINFLKLATSSTIPNKELNDVLIDFYKKKSELLETEQKEISEEYHPITEWEHLNVEEINVLFAHYRKTTLITLPYILSLERNYTLDEINILLKTEYKSFYEITFSQYYIIKSSNNKFNLFSNDYPILSNIDFELGIQYSKLCPDFKMFYLKFYELMMIDIDGQSLEDVKKKLTEYQDKFTFRIYKSYNGYHIFITSELIQHASNKMSSISQLFSNDIFYLKFAYKNGFKIRLSPKINRDETFISSYVCKIGTQKELPELVKLMKIHDYFVNIFEDIYFRNSSLALKFKLPEIPISKEELSDEEKLALELQYKNLNPSNIYEKIIKRISTGEHKFYGQFLSLNYNLQKFLAMYPETKLAFDYLNKNKIRKYLLEDSDTHKMNYSSNTEFLRFLYISLTNFLLKPQRLLIDDDQYYVALDTYTKTYYICYKKLLMCDIDSYKDNLGNTVESSKITDLVNSYAIENNLTFQVYKSRNGFHLFLTSKRMSFKSEESNKIMTDLKCDFYYILYSKIRGWSVRLNRKEKETSENLYEYLGTYGNVKEDDNLVKLVTLHILLSETFKKLDPSLIYNG